MPNIIAIFFSLILGISNPSEVKNTENQQEPVSTYYLIRHAEKDRTDSSNRNPDLKREGLARAKKWAEVLKSVDFDAIYSTDYKRTLQTAKPLADHNQLEILKYDAGKLFEESFENDTKGKTVLVVGHSNTTPQFVNAILGEKKYADLDDSENGALFIVQVMADGSSHSQVLYIN
ncbi:SixA phosphatase family protein [Christiangramia sabulilitoris]|uniref:Histidine phosphatase family protein n=1 Tax=Christiangramia sabulilitoris TaxID=2583991 RepID=A0A550I2U8_9FLAO|nr:phosphoglycerate mutase family protein [Christiangramia sabulilitoris]TRO65312.1 histidine phosphatase family protein [Christiangramia sabulilitoris]